MHHIPYIILLLLSSTALQGQDNTLKVLTFNILHGATTQNDFDLDKIAEVINNTQADLVALQEVDFKTNRAKGFDLATELAQRTKMTPYYAMAMPFDGGGYGEAVLSTWPIISARNISLPHSPENEPRAIALIDLRLPSGDTISFAGTHLDHLANDNDRYAQAMAINKNLLPAKFPTILAGDLNDIPGSRSITLLEEYWTPSYDRSAPAPTYSSAEPKKKIDYIMYHPQQKWTIEKTEVVCDEIASDHCAYLVHIRLKK